MAFVTQNGAENAQNGREPYFKRCEQRRAQYTTSNDDGTSRLAFEVRTYDEQGAGGDGTDCVHVQFVQPAGRKSDGTPRYKFAVAHLPRELLAELLNDLSSVLHSTSVVESAS